MPGLVAMAPVVLPEVTGFCKRTLPSSAVALRHPLARSPGRYVSATALSALTSWKNERVPFVATAAGCTLNVSTRSFTLAIYAALEASPHAILRHSSDCSSAYWSRIVRQRAIAR